MTAEKEIPVTSSAIERLRKLLEKAQYGPIVGFRTRFRSSDDQDQTLVNAAGEELAVTYSEDAARVFSAAVNALPALLECAEALERIAARYENPALPVTDEIVSPHDIRAAVNELAQSARAALDALAKEVE